jgi:alkylation response protein AidB-like acyl-CoA dehydrogenase
VDHRLSDEHEALRKSVESFARDVVAPQAEESDRTGEFPYDVVRQMGEMGLFGLPFPEECGGMGGDFLALCLAIEELARVDSSVAITLEAAVGLGSMPVFRFGSAEQKERWLPSLCRGAALSAFGLTEPGGGSDAGNAKTKAVLDGDEWVINGTKNWITNLGVADFYICFAVTDRESRRITAFVVEADRPGFSVGKLEHKLGIRASPTGQPIFEDVRVPHENVIGEVGRGLRVALGTLERTRLGAAAQAVGIAQGATDYAVAYARERRQFGQAINEFQGIQFKLADMQTRTAAARELLYKACAMADRGDPQRAQYSSMAKVFASDTAMAVTVEAVQVLGGYGYVKEYPVERMMRDAKITQIYEGTNEIQRLVIARTLK